MTLHISEIVNQFRPDLAGYENLYQLFHANPELSFQEHETSTKISEELLQWDTLEIQTGIGKTGVAAALENGAGPVILLRADIDALPVEEKTGLSYASTKRMKNLEGVEKPVMHVRMRQSQLPIQSAYRRLIFTGMRSRHAHYRPSCSLRPPHQSPGALERHAHPLLPAR